MAEKITTDKNINEIKKNLKENKVIIGTEKCMKALKNSAVKKIFITSNCPKSIEDDIDYYAKLANAAVVKIPQRNDELGVICKKPFDISVLCI